MVLVCRARTQVTDFIDILLYYHRQDQWSSVTAALGEQCIRQWAGAQRVNAPKSPAFFVYTQRTQIAIRLVAMLRLRCVVLSSSAIKASMHTSIPHLLSIEPEGTLWEALEIVQRCAVFSHRAYHCLPSLIACRCV